jgi:nucleoside-diphosphate-sugar epimerase
VKVFLTGATGYLGSAVAAALLKARYRVSALVRNPQALLDPSVEKIVGDLRRPDLFSSALASADAVVHVALSWNPAGPESDQGPVAEMLRQIRCPFVYTSGVWLLGDTRGARVDERCALNPLPLVSWRPAVEKLVLAHPQGIVVRPGCVYGGTGGLFGALWKQAAAGTVSLVGDGSNRWAKIHRDDLASLYVAFLDKRPFGRVYHAADGDESTMRQVAEGMLQAAGRPGSVSLSAPDEARTRLGALVEGLTVDQRVSSDKARREMMWTPRYSFLRDLPKLYAEWRAA